MSRVRGLRTGDAMGRVRRCTVEDDGYRLSDELSEAPRHLCLDKGYDDQEPRGPAEAFGFTLHLRTRGAAVAGRHEAGRKARRRVVERTGSTASAASSSAGTRSPTTTPSKERRATG